MQTLRTRAAQSTCICKCAFCRSTTALSRTTTSSAFKPRVRFRDIFTVFYSTVLTSAAVADAYRKDARRKEWETAIQAAKEEVAAIEEQQRRRISSLSLGAGESPETTSSIEKTWLIENTWDKVFQSAASKSKERELLGFQNLVGPPLGTLRGLSTDEIRDILNDPAIIRLNNGIESDADFDPIFWGRPSRLRPYGLKQVKRAEWSVRKLAYRFLLSCEEDSLQRKVEADQQASNSCATSMTKRRIMDRIETCERALRFIISSPRDPLLWLRMRSPRVPSYNRQIDHDAASINDRLLELFQSFKDSGTGINTLLSSISSLLLFAPNPPDVHFYNMLIIGLCQLHQMTDVHAVIESMRECSVRPNATTLSAMLNYYTITQKESGFCRLTREIDGLQGGVFEEHPSRNISPGLADRYRTYDYSRKETAIQAEDEELLYNQPRYSYLTPDGTYPLERCGTRKVIGTARMGLLDGTVYNALISGSLELGLLGQAMRYYSQMISDGFKANRPLLESILKHCTQTRDWDAGMAVWKQLCKLAEGINSIVIGLMLTLCRACENSIEYGKVFDYGVRKGLIPSASSVFPSDVAVGLTNNIPDTYDLIAFPRQPYLRWCIARDSLERAVELLAYQIAITALDFAAMDIDARKKSVGFKVYLRTMSPYRDSPAAIAQRRAKSGGYGVVNGSEANTARAALSNAPGGTSGQCGTKTEPSLGNDRSQKMLPDPLGGKTPSSEDNNYHQALDPSRDAVELSPEMDEIQGSAVDGVRDPETPSIDGKVHNASMKLRAETEPLTNFKPKVPVLQLPKATHLAKESDILWKFTRDRTQATLDEQKAESQLVQKPSTGLQISMSEHGQRPQSQHKLQPSASGLVKSPIDRPARQTAGALEPSQPLLAIEERGSHSSDPLPSNTSVNALIEWDYDPDCLSNKENAHEFLEGEQPIVGCVHPLQRHEDVQMIQSRITESEVDREYIWRAYDRKIGDDCTLTSDPTQTERLDENVWQEKEVAKLLPVEQSFLRHTWKDTTQTPNSGTQPPLAIVYCQTSSNIEQHSSTEHHTKKPLFLPSIEDDARPENGQHRELSPVEQSPRKQLANDVPQALECNNHAMIRNARNRRRKLKKKLKKRGGKLRLKDDPILVNLESDKSVHLTDNSFTPDKVSCSALREKQVLDSEQEMQESSWRTKSISAKEERSGHGRNVRWKSVLEKPESIHQIRFALASERDPRPAWKEDETPSAQEEAQQPLLATVRRLIIVGDANSGSCPISVISDFYKIDGVGDASVSGEGSESACGNIENADSKETAQTPVYAMSQKQNQKRLRPIRPTNSGSPPSTRKVKDKKPKLRPMEQP